ncbi:hypothetical protein OEZ85_000653 [Tetradesmus obliquus]|uniref:Uncharacterized protein n=1 Tax=Tetradesmus obliquus TaxID=3088 RepID=A0ABY8UIU0_TETOB|nr:hypothetical protein OEZ85_000653 [Tetradesmus obliquus]
MLQQRSGAKMSVSYSGTEVTISGSAAAVQAAAGLLRQQIETFLTSGGGYPHPLQVHYLLSSSYGADCKATVRFLFRDDEVAQAAGRREELYELQPEHPAAGVWAPAGDIDTLTDALSGVQLGGSRLNGTPIHLAGQQHSVVQQLVAAAAQGVRHSPAFDEVKIRFNFGKALWYFPCTAAPHSWTIQQMQAKQIPRDLKCVFSNGVQASQVHSLQEWLASKGFEVVETKERASVHLLQHGANASYSLSFIKQRDGGLTLRKAKSGSSKLFFLTLLNSSGQPDWRAKLLGQYHFQQGSETQALLARIAAGATLAGSKLRMPGLSAHDMSLDKERHKSKTIYVGPYSSSSSSSSRRSLATEIKVSVSRVSSADGCGDGWEVAGTSSQANTLLQQMLARGTASAAQQEQLAAHVNNMVAFAQEAAAALMKDERQQQPLDSSPYYNDYYDDYYDRPYSDDYYGE